MKNKIVIILILWIALAFLINPVVEMSYGDDWAYAKPVQTYLQTGKIHFTDWSSMTLIFHLYWGILFCKIFGYSMTILRISMIVMGFGGILATIYFLKEFIQNKKTLFWCSLFVILNPIYIIHCFTFFTDITFYTLIFASSVFFIKFLKKSAVIIADAEISPDQKNVIPANAGISPTNDKEIPAFAGMTMSKLFNSGWGFFILANIFSLFAVLTRDVALVVPPAFSIAYLFWNGFNKKSITVVFISLFVVFSGFFGFRYWLVHIHGITASIDFSRNKMFEIYSSGIIRYLSIYGKNIFFTLIFFGLYFFPFAYYPFKNELMLLNKKKKINMIVIISLIFCFLTVALFKVPKLYTQTYQLTFNTIYLVYYWFGDIHNPSINSVFVLPGIIANLLLLTGIAGGVMMSYVIIKRIIEYFNSTKRKILGKRDGMNEFIYLCFFVYIIPILSQGFTNRYMLFLFPFVVIILFRNNFIFEKSKLSLSFLTIFAVLLGYFSIAGTHDILAFLRAREHCTTYLEKELKISPANIDAGFEYNAWHFYNYYYKQDKKRNWWWVQKDDYIVTWGEIIGFTLLKKEPYKRWIPPGRTDYYYVYKRGKI